MLVCLFVCTTVCVTIGHVCQCVRRQEVDTLEKEVVKSKARYQETVCSAKDVGNTISALPQFVIRDNFVLNQDQAWYTLSIEIQSPIDTVMLQVRTPANHFIEAFLTTFELYLTFDLSQSDVPLDLQDVDKSSAVVSYTHPDPEVPLTDVHW